MLALLVQEANRLSQEHNRLLEENERRTQEYNRLLEESDRLTQEYNRLLEEHDRLSQQRQQEVQRRPSERPASAATDQPAGRNVAERLMTCCTNASRWMNWLLWQVWD
jgi:chromosome segregation ATPase